MFFFLLPALCGDGRQMDFSLGKCLIWSKAKRDFLWGMDNVNNVVSKIIMGQVIFVFVS